MPSKKEIERKWRLDRLPDKKILKKGKQVIQEYVLADEASEIRLRMIQRNFFLTIKGSGLGERDEWEARIPGWVYRIFLKLGIRDQVVKVRYEVRDSGNILEFDEYLGRHKGLFILECEFEDRKEARIFELPEWVEAMGAKEVTEDARYKNKNLALYGLPK